MATVIGFVVVALFAMACVAIWSFMGNLDLERHADHDAPAVVVGNGRGDRRCMLCDQPLRRVATSDEVVYAIERHIGDENAAVVRLLSRPEPENIQRLYVA
jgi:hypothetical protein